MSDASDTKQSAPSGDFRIGPDSNWQHAWKMAAGLAFVGLIASGAGYASDPRRFAFSYLMGFAAVMTMCLGAMFFVLYQHLTSAGWSVTVRRTAEFFVAGMVVVPILFLPNLLSLSELYPWWDHGDNVAHAQEHAEAEGAAEAHGGAVHGAAAAHGEHGGEAAHGAEGAAHHGPEHAAHERIMSRKGWYLNQPFFIGRLLLVFGVWLWLSRRLFKLSTAQDTDGDPQHTVKLQRVAPVGTILFALTLTVGGVDWIMSMQPAWFSTMFGVRVFASGNVVALSLIILVSLGLRKAGVVGREINVEHYHDLGKLLFGFLVFWGYISFSEFLLIWYAAIPEETIYYHYRWHDSWIWISVAIVVLKFIVPFYLVISRNAKRNLSMLGMAAGWLCVMHFVEMYYWVMPNYALGEDVSASPMHFVTDLGGILLPVGIYLAVVFRRMLNYSVIAKKDPRLGRALDFVNA